ncbi:ATP-binding protein [Natronobiforma cellulositropha]|uniref:ATP-binding protein n=1 Tax=Natronobiforma cellulositropha TaxID=1679076 RepID=UPI0021D609E0|nr:ATP-binding protein [Natronobiforma cellulositropha]
MSGRDTAPRTVLSVGTDEHVHAELGAVFGRDDALSLETASSIAAARELLDADSPAGPVCLVSGGSLPDGSPADLLAAARAQTPPAPVVFTPPTDTPELLRAAAGAGVSYLPTTADPTGETLLACVRDHLETAARSRTHHDSHRILEALLEQPALELYVKDRDARCLRLSKRACAEMWADPTGKTELEISSSAIEREARRAHESDVAVIESGDPILERDEPYLEFVEDDETFWRRTSRFPWHDEEGTVQGVVGVRCDVTEEKRLERDLHYQRQRLERLASFAAHDLRNPLNIAHGYLEYALETGTEEPLEQTRAALEQLRDLIDDLVTTARTELDEPSIAPVELSPAVESAWDAVSVDSSTLDSRVSDGATVWADPHYLSLLLENLFKNAIVHAGTTVDVTVGVTDTGFFVEDDGPGIAEHERESVLEYGYTTTDGGTGVGLAIVNQVVGVHDWSLSITDGRAGGARFDVEDCLVVAAPREHTRAGEHTAVRLTDHVDVGEATPPGSSRYDESAGRWTVHGGGVNLWYDTDECHFAYTEVDGDARIVARLRESEHVTTYSKAGLAIRASPESGAPLGFVGAIGGGQSEVIWRPDSERYLVSTQFEAATDGPHWYRLDRVGPTVTAYHSSDGETWVPIDERRIECGETVSVGLLVCSLDPSRLASAVFDEVAVFDLGQ